MNSHAAILKNTPSLYQDFPIPGNACKHDNFGLDDFTEAERFTQEDGDSSNLDDALDDDNEHPFGQTLIDAAENTGPQTIDQTKRLESEVDEDGEE